MEDRVDEVFKDSGAGEVPVFCYVAYKEDCCVCGFCEFHDLFGAVTDLCD